MAAQLTVTIGLSLRVLMRCTCLAASSLPVPVSPTISTVESVVATRPMVSSRPLIFEHALLWK